jgi:hypothetical protein
MRTIRSSLLALMLGATPAAMLIATAQAQVSVNLRINSAPPPLPYYEAGYSGGWIHLGSRLLVLGQVSG